MSFENKYPYTDFHELNLDWFLTEFKKVMDDNIRFKEDMTEKYATMKGIVDEFTAFVTNYFDNLDVQQEINNKLDVMAADGTLDELLLPYFNAYKAEINGIVADQNRVLNTQNGRITVLEGRMDSFASLTEGSTTGDAELMDIRVGANGVTYPSAGDAVRGQVDDLQDEIDDINAKIVTKTGINLFDKTKAISGYIKTDGTIGANASYITSDYIEITDSTLTFSGVQTAGSGVGTYDAGKTFIDRVDMIDVHGETMTFGDSVKYIRFSTQAVTEDTAMVEYGSSASAYQPYIEWYEFSKQKYAATSYTLEVCYDGSKDYKTINEAVNAALDLESEATPVTILIYPGVYEEVVELTGAQHYISFIGINKKEVIWVDNSGAYANSPLHYASNGLIKGITFLATHDDDPDFIQYMLDHNPNNFGSYALHIDDTSYTAEDDPYELRIEDCVCISKHNAAIGIGMRPNETLIIKDCEFRTDLPIELENLSNSKKGAFLIHDASHLLESVPQNCFIDNCRMYKNVSFALGLVTPTIPGAMTLYFYNNILWSDERGKADNVVNGSASANIHNSSSCNNVSVLNK